MKADFLLKIGSALALAAFLSGCGKSAGEPNLPHVTVMLPREQAVADYMDLSGTVSASQTVDLVARVPGYLQSVNFKDGADVETGQLLFVIEPEPYEEQLKIYQAGLTQAQSEYDRQLQLIKQNATSVASLEKWHSQRDEAEAQVALAKINLGYTHVTAPFSGRIGRHMVDVGNMVGVSGSTKLATLNAITPCYVYFNLNERDALRIREAIRKSGGEAKNSMGKAPVLVGLQTEEGYPHQGTLDFIDNGASTSSGTIQIRAVLPNEEKTLFPGIFARVRVPLGEPQLMFVVPNQIIGNDQEGDYVLVVDANNIVVRRSIVKGPLTGSDCGIQSGLKAEDRVIINGLSNVQAGDKVSPENAAKN